MDPKRGRKFLHDMASPMTVSALLVKKLLKKQESQATLSPEEIAQLERIQKSLEKMEAIHSEFKFELRREEIGEMKNPEERRVS